MPYPHAIRLRGPWDFEVLASAADRPGQNLAGAPVANRVELPCDWQATLGVDFRGKVRYRRRFNRPTGLDPHERVWLVVEGVDAFGAAALNGSKLGEVRGYALPASFDVTGLLSPSNELAIDVELPAETSGAAAPMRPGRETLAGGPIGEVRLEIRTRVFLERLAIWTTRDGDETLLNASGHVGGEEDAGPLAVIVNGAQRELLYGDVQAGAPFQLSGPLGELASGGEMNLEIKLLAGGSASWQAARTLYGGEGPKTPAAELRQILPEASYVEFDRAAQAVVQFVPLAWADEVCPRLAHHRSIVAWAASDAELAEAGDERLQRLAFGRTWLGHSILDAWRRASAAHSG